MDDEPLPEGAIAKFLDDRPGHAEGDRTDGWIRANARRHPNDGRSNTRTTFYPDDVDSVTPPQKHRAPEDRRSWSDLASWNDGVGEPDRWRQNSWADKARWAEIFGTQLDASSYLIEETTRIVDLIDARAGQYPQEAYVFAVLSLLIDQTVYERARSPMYEPGHIEHRTLNRENAQRLLDDLDLDTNDIMSVRRHIRKKYAELVF
jgi:hypothetical protein